MGKFCQCLTELPARGMIMAGYCYLMFSFYLKINWSKINLIGPVVLGGVV